MIEIPIIGMPVILLQYNGIDLLQFVFSIVFFANNINYNA